MDTKKFGGRLVQPEAVLCLLAILFVGGIIGIALRNRETEDPKTVISFDTEPLLPNPFASNKDKAKEVEFYAEVKDNRPTTYIIGLCSKAVEIPSGNSKSIPLDHIRIGFPRGRPADETLSMIDKSTFPDDWLEIGDIVRIHAVIDEQSGFIRFKKIRKAQMPLKTTIQVAASASIAGATITMDAQDELEWIEGTVEKQFFQSADVPEIEKPRP